MNQNFFDGNSNEREQALVASTHSNSEGSSQSSISDLNRGEIDKLKNLLGSLGKPSLAGTCSLAFLGISSSSCVTNVLDIVSSNTWVIDSEATDHMICSSKKIISYMPCSSHRKITMPMHLPPQLPDREMFLLTTL